MRMNPLSLLLGFLPLVLFLAASLAPAHAVSPGPVNILFITVDDMSCDSIGAFGCELADTSPNVDKLAAQGKRFEHAHVVVGNCKPSRLRIRCVWGLCGCGWE